MAIRIYHRAISFRGSHQTRMHWIIHVIHHQPLTAAFRTRKYFGLTLGYKGRSAGAALRGGVMPVTFVCDTGDDIIMKICSVCGSHGRTPFFISVVGEVMDPSIILFGKRIKHEGIYTIINLAGFTSPFGTDDASTSFNFTISIGGPAGKVFGGRVSGPLIAASEIHVILGLNPPIEASDDNTDTSSDADAIYSSECQSGLSSV